jgi:hypothetical protein
MPYDFADILLQLTVFISKHGFRVIENFKTGNYIEVIFQFQLNYIKNILPAIRKDRYFLFLSSFSSILTAV